jgi:WD40 repeat protein
VILAEQRSGSMQLIDLRSELQLGTLWHSTPVQDLMFSPDSKSLATCCEDGSVFLWNVATGEWFTRLANPGGRGVKVQFSADSRKLAAIIALESSSDPKGEPCAAKVLVWNSLDSDQREFEHAEAF